MIRCCVLLPLLVLSLVVQEKEKKETPAEAEVRGLVEKYYAAWNAKDLKTLEGYLAPNFSHPLHRNPKEHLEKLGIFVKQFPVFTLTWRTDRVWLTHPDRAKVRGQLTQKVKFLGDDSTDYHDLCWTLVKLNGTWKLQRIQPAWLDFYQSLAEQPEKADRLKLIAAEEDFFLEFGFLNELYQEIGNLRRQGLYPIAIQACYYGLEAAEGIREKPRREMCVAQVKHERANLAMDQSDIETAEKLMEEAMVVYRQQGAKTYVAMMTGSLGAIKAQRGKFLEGRKLTEEGLALAAQLFAGKAKPGDIDISPLGIPVRNMIQASLLGNLGFIQSEMGEYTAARKSLEESLKLAAQLVDRSVFRTAKLNLATLEMHECNFDKAAVIYEEIAAIAEKEKQFPLLGQVLNNWAIGLSHQGKTTEALAKLALSQRLATALGNRHSLANTHFNFALVYYRLDQEDKAIAALREALKLYQQLKDERGEARVRIFLLTLSAEVAKPDDIIKEFNEAYGMLQRSGADSAKLELFLHYGLYLDKIKRFDEARKAKLAALALCRQQGDRYRELLLGLQLAKTPLANGKYWLNLREIERIKKLIDEFPEPRLVAQYHTELGTIWTDNEEWAKAIPHLRQALQERKRQLSGLEDPLLRGAGDKLGAPRLFAALVKCQVESGQFTEAFATLEEARATGLTAALARTQTVITKTLSRGLVSRETELREALACSLRECLAATRDPKLAPAERQSYLQKQLDRQRAYDDFKARQAAEFSPVNLLRGESQPTSLQELQARLLRNHPRMAVLTWMLDDRGCYLFVVTPGENEGSARLRVQKLPCTVQELEKATADYVSLCKTSSPATPSSPDLYDWLITPAEKELEGKAHVLIVPTGCLCQLPFAALRANEEQPYLVEKFAISYAPSLTALLGMSALANQRKAERDREPLLAVGRPKFSPEWTDLPATEGEVKEISKTVGSYNPPLLGAEATRPRVLERMKQPRWLHFATHGKCDSERPMFSLLALTPTGKKDDGRLYARELLDANLQAEMAVLSACETGLGKHYAGEGMLGLTWAFFVAGCPTVVASLWLVPSESTAELMKEFYRQYVSDDKPSKAEALRQAQLKVMKTEKWKHPAYWAAFGLNGHFDR